MTSPDGAEKSLPEPSPAEADPADRAPHRLRRAAGLLLRVAVSALVLAWVFTKVPFKDRPRLALEGPTLTPTRIEGELVAESPEGVTVLTASGRPVTVPLAALQKREALPPRRGIVSILATASPAALAAFFAIYLAPFLLTTYRWWLLVVDQGVSISFATAIRLNFIGTFFNNFLLGATGGDVVKAALVGAGTGRAARVLSTVLLDRVIGLAVVALIGSGALLVSTAVVSAPERERMFFPALFVSLTLLGFVAMYLVYYSRRVRASAPARWVKARLPLQGALREMDAVFQEYRRKPKLVATTLGVSLASQSAMICGMVVGGGAIGIVEAAPWHYFVFLPMIQVISAVPITVNAWGVGEGAYQTLFGLVGVPGEKAVTLSLLGKLVGILFGLPGGILFALGRRKGIARGTG